MLANGAKLEFKSKTVTTYTKLKGLKEIPEIGVDPEKVENTDLDDTQKMYEMGIGDPGDITYKFKYDNTAKDSPYRVLRAYEASGENLSFNYNKRNQIAIGDAFYNDVHNLLVATPLMPVYDQQGRYYDMESKQTEGWKLNDGASNPLGLIAADHGQNLNRGYSLYSNAYLEIQPIKNLKFKSSFGFQMSASSYRSYKEDYNFATTVTNSPDKVYQSMASGYRYTCENTLSY